MATPIYTAPATQPKKQVLLINNFFNEGGSTECVLNAVDNAKYDYTFLGNTTFGVGAVRQYQRELSRRNQKTSLLYVNNRVDFSFDHSDLSDCEISARTRNPTVKVSRFRELVEHHKPDILHVFIPGEQSLQYLDIVKDFKMKRICTVLCDQRIGFDPNIFDEITFISKYLYNKNQDLLPTGKGVVIYPGVKNGYRGGLPHETMQIGRISAFCPSKKLEHTVACAELFPDCDFVIAGQIQDHSYYNFLVNLQKEKNLSNLHFEANISHWRKVELLNKLHLYHYPTSAECFCISIAEAMEKELPVISYRNSAIPEFIEGEKNHGFALCDDFYQLVDETRKMIDLWKSDQKEFKKLGQLNQKIYQKKYSVEQYTKSIMKLYE